MQTFFDVKLPHFYTLLRMFMKRKVYLDRQGNGFSKYFTAGLKLREVLVMERQQAISIYQDASYQVCLSKIITVVITY